MSALFDTADYNEMVKNLIKDPLTISEEMTAAKAGAIHMVMGICGEAGELLDATYDILVRTGLHCAPLAHRTLGTYPDGTVRVSMGYFNTVQDVQRAAEAMRKIAEKAL